MRCSYSERGIGTSGSTTSTRESKDSSTSTPVVVEVHHCAIMSVYGSSRQIVRPRSGRNRALRMPQRAVNTAQTVRVDQGPSPLRRESPRRRQVVQRHARCQPRRSPPRLRPFAGARRTRNSRTTDQALARRGSTSPRRSVLRSGGTAGHEVRLLSRPLVLQRDVHAGSAQPRQLRDGPASARCQHVPNPACSQPLADSLGPPVVLPSRHPPQ